MRIAIARAQGKTPRHLALLVPNQTHSMSLRQQIYTKVLRGKAKPVAEPRDGFVVYRFNSAYISRLTEVFPEAERSDAVERELDLLSMGAPPPGWSPRGLKGTLYDFQTEDVWRAIHHDNFFFLWDMGCGKTVAALSVAAHHRAFPALVICPSTVKEVWRREICKWFDDIKPMVIGGTRDQRCAQILDPKPDVKIINYECIRIHPELADMHWKLIIVDETQRCSNPKTKAAKALHRLDAPRKILMSGPQPLWAKVLTPSGWKLMGDLVAHDPIIGRDGRTYRVCQVFDQGEQEVFEVRTSDGATTWCTSDHLWAYQTPWDMSLRKDHYRVAALKDLELTDPGKHNYKIALPIPEPTNDFVSSEKRVLDPYLLGLLLGDGSFGPNRVSLANTDKSVLRAARHALPQSVCLRPGGNDNYPIVQKQMVGNGQGENEVTNAVRTLGLWGQRSDNKAVPECYKWAPSDVRLSVLQGLLDSDGWMSDHTASIEFTSVSRQLAEDVVFMVRSLGGQANIHRGIYDRSIPKRRYNKDRWRVHLRLPQNTPPFLASTRKRQRWDRWRKNNKTKYRITRKIVSVVSIGTQPTRCISTDIPDQLYVTDDFVVTHNTPTRNGRLEELWSPLKFGWPSHWPDWWGFLSRYTIRQGSNWIIGYRNQQDVVKFLEQHGSRRLKEDVLKDLPPVVHSVLYVDLGPEQRKRYREIKEQFLLSLADGSIKNITSVLAQLTRLKQACFSPELYGGSGTSSKVAEVRSQVEEITSAGHKVVVFSQWARASRILLRELEAYNPAYVDGQVPMDQRTKEIERFQTDPETLCYIGTYGANKEGITLTAGSYVIRTDLPWVPADDDQAVARLSRIGQTKTVNAIEIRAADTLEDGIADKVGFKRQMINALVDRKDKVMKPNFLNSIKDVL